MTAPTLASDIQFARVQKLIHDLLGKKILKEHDRKKLFKIFRYSITNNAVTEKQYRAFVHYCQVYDVRLDNSVEFILSD